MADTIFDTRANPDVTSTTTQTQTAPSYYTNYLSGLSQAGQTALANPNNVAPLTAMQEQGWAATPTAAAAYKPGLSAAEATAGKAAAGAAPQIGEFMNPYTSNVVDEMARLQQQNVQRNLMPQLKAGFVGTGGLGSSRYANAMGQTMADLQSNLTGQQYGALSAGYKNAVDAALNNAQLQNQAARTQGDLATSEQSLGLTGAGALTKAGTEQQAYQQSLIDAPLKEATNVSGLLRGYTVPGSSTATTTGPQTSGYYQGSPLAQTLGVAAQIASGLGTGTTYDKYGNSITQPNYLQKIFDSTGLSGLASSAGSSISNYIKGVGSGSGGSSSGSSGGGKPGEMGTGTGNTGPEMNTSDGVRYNSDGTITDSAGNKFDSGGNYIGPDTSTSGGPLDTGYTPPTSDYYTSPEYYQSQLNNSLLDSSSVEGTDFAGPQYYDEYMGR